MRRLARPSLPSDVLRPENLVERRSDAARLAGRFGRPLPRLTDEQLAGLIAESDREAFAVVYARHLPALIVGVGRRLGH